MLKTKVICIYLFVCTAFLYSCRGKQAEHQVNKQALALNDSASRMYFKVIGLVYPMDSLERSIDIFQDAIKIDPEYRTAYSNLWDCLNYAGRYKESEALCTTWIGLNPDDADFIMKRGLVREVIGKKDLAEVDYATALKSMSNDPLPDIDSSLDAQEIQKIMGRAYNLFVVKGNNQDGLMLLKSLKEAFPDNQQIISLYQGISQKDRDEYVRDLVHFRK